MSNERRKYPRIELGGVVNIQVAGIVRHGTLLNLSPSGIHIECNQELIEQLQELKSAVGLYPEFELDFTLRGTKQKAVESVCSVSYCRRLNQQLYHLGLNFLVISDADEKEVEDYIKQAVAA
ncbi:MAG: PilZ domain-containing protein [Proteobacteria bacterium]|nr:PilZ domain-containing protein [Pseudomonadota bacterium]